MSPRRIALRIIVTATVALVPSACGDRSGRQLDDPVFDLPATTAIVETLPPEPTSPPALQLVAPWVDGAAVPKRQTCSGDGVAPALTWTNVPMGTVELAITVTDPDAGGFVHWIVYGIPTFTTGFAEGVLPNDVFEWENTAGTPGWFPLCPPPGETHRYVFSVLALNQQLEVADDADAPEVISILDQIAIARSSVSGLASVDP